MPRRAAPAPARDGEDRAAFDAYHRAERWAALRRRVPLALLAGSAAAGLLWAAISVTPPHAAATQLAGQPTAATPVAGLPAVATQVAGLPAGLNSTSLAGASAHARSDASATAAGGTTLPTAPGETGDSAGGTTLPASPGETGDSAGEDRGDDGAGGSGQQHVNIDVDTRGFQDELDRCLWVRMDVGASAPIVGAHNFCEGDVVLGLTVGDLVSIGGTDLDGDYQVTGDRTAHAGDDAATATSGLTADLLLQTCYWDDSGLRLVALRRVDLSLPPTPAP